MLDKVTQTWYYVSSMKDKEYYTVKEVADILDVTPRTIYHYIKKGYIAKHQLFDGGGIRVHKLDIPTYQRNQRLSNIGETEEMKGEAK